MCFFTAHSEVSAVAHFKNYTVKKAVELLDVTLRNATLMSRPIRNLKLIDH
jgi:hypothetical protein